MLHCQHLCARLTEALPIHKGPPGAAISTWPVHACLRGPLHGSVQRVDATPPGARRMWRHEPGNPQGRGLADVRAAGMQELALVPGNMCRARQLTRGCGNNRAVSMQRACRSLRAAKSFSSPCPTRMVSADTIWHTRLRTSGSVVSTCSEEWEFPQGVSAPQQAPVAVQSTAEDCIVLVCALAALSNKIPLGGGGACPPRAAAWRG